VERIELRWGRKGEWKQGNENENEVKIEGTEINKENLRAKTKGGQK
jgi:hypothetical protein